MAKMLGFSMQFVQVCSVTGEALIREMISPAPEIDDDGNMTFLCMCHMQPIRYRAAGPMARDSGDDDGNDQD